MPTSETQVDVLVIGAGPAGVMCANALGKFGVKVKIVDLRWAKAQVAMSNIAMAR